MRLSKLFVVASCLSALSLSSHAETLNTLYQVHETVTSQTPEERNQTLQKALDTLVLKLTGDDKSLQNAGLAAIRKDPQQIISQYGYDAGPPQNLVVDFDPVSTDRALRAAGLSLWGSNRPSILVWWVNDATDGSSLVGDAQASAAPLRMAGQHRGLPLRLPLADLSEQLVATGDALEKGKVDVLRPISERYSADAILAVHAHQEGGQWQAKWRLWLGDKAEQGTATGADATALADALMLTVSQRLATRFVAKPGAPSTGLTLQVQGVTFEHYAALGHLLEPFGAKLQSMDGQTVTYQVNGNAEQLRAQLKLAHLQEVAPDAPAASAAPVAAPAPSATPGSTTPPGAPSTTSGTPATSATAPANQPPVDPNMLRFRW